MESSQLKDKLLHPQIAANKPLDLLFERVAQFLQVPSGMKPIPYIYEKLSSNDQVDNFTKRCTVIDKGLEYMLEIQQLSIEEKLQAKNKELITISLPDMKIFGNLLNLIIIHGFYSLFPPGVGVPLERRRLKDSNNAVPIITKVKDQGNAESLLHNLVTKLWKIFQIGGDVKTLLMRGSGFSDLLIAVISLNCNPLSTTRDPELFQQIESISPTFELFSLYTLLLQPYSAPWVRKFASQRLSLLTVERKDGVMSLIEFVVGMRDDEQINIEKIDHVSRILISKPQLLDSKSYFQNIGSQLYDILVLINRPILQSIAIQIIESIFERNQAIIQDFIILKLDKNFHPEGDDEILTTQRDLNNLFNVIVTFSKNSSVELLNLVFYNILHPLWTYLLFNKLHNRDVGTILDCFVSYFAITDNQQALDSLVRNLLTINDENWEYSIGDSNLVQIVPKQADLIQHSNEFFFTSLDTAVELMILIMKGLNDELITVQFSTILQNWLQMSNLQIETLENEENPYLLLINLKMLESMVDNFKDRLSKSPESMLIVVERILNTNSTTPLVKSEYTTIIKQEDSDDEDEQEEVSESLQTSLELLSLVLSETSVDKLSQESITILQKMITPLKKLSSTNRSAQALHDRITLILQSPTPLQEIQVDRATLDRAITSLHDPLIPIRAHGLYLLRQLISNKTNVISLPKVIELHLIQLKDPEPYIYLNVIKGLSSLLQSNTELTLPKLLQLYQGDKHSLDERLRIGEVLMRYVSQGNEILPLEIVTTALHLVRVDSRQDNNLRMSAMSLLGICCQHNPISMVPQLPDCFDCVLGILNLETTQQELPMRRAAVVLINDLVMAPQGDGLLSIPGNYLNKCVTILKYLVDTDNDVLCRDQLKDVLYHIQQLFE